MLIKFHLTQSNVSVLTRNVISNVLPVILGFQAMILQTKLLAPVQTPGPDLPAVLSTIVEYLPVRVTLLGAGAPLINQFDQLPAQLATLVPPPA